MPKHDKGETYSGGCFMFSAYDDALIHQDRLLFALALILQIGIITYKAGKNPAEYWRFLWRSATFQQLGSATILWQGRSTRLWYLAHHTPIVNFLTPRYLEDVSNRTQFDRRRLACRTSLLGLRTETDVSILKGGLNAFFWAHIHLSGTQKHKLTTNHHQNCCDTQVINRVTKLCF